MNSKIIKFVAGAGKTSYSLDYLKLNKNGLYLAFNNSVVDDVSRHGFISRTIDSFFQSFLIPKFIDIIPIISCGSEIKYVNLNNLSNSLKGIGNIHIHEDGKIFNNKRDTGIELNTSNDYIFKNHFRNDYFLHFIFSKEFLNLTDELRSELSFYLIANYGSLIIDFIKKRFSYVIIDEAQDLKDYREWFAKLLYESNVELLILGDDNQNINNGGNWFLNLKADEIKNVSFRCPEGNCKWIRENLDIEIYGNDDSGEYIVINMNDTLNYDNGSRVLLYKSKSGNKLKEIIKSWKGPKRTIQNAKGDTIYEDIVIVGNSLSRKFLYTAITRTKKKTFSTIERIND